MTSFQINYITFDSDPDHTCPELSQNQRVLC